MSKLEKIKITIQKLLALSEKNNNDYEALQAIEKARNLMLKYNIDKIEDKTKDKTKDLKVVNRSSGIKLTRNWKKIMFNRLKNYLKVELYIQQRTMFIMGLDDDVQMAITFWTALENAISTMSKIYVDRNCITGRARQSHINSYVNGFIMAISESFKKQNDDIEENFKLDGRTEQTALVLATPEIVKKEYANYTSGFTTSKFRYNYSTSNKPIQEGYKDGKAFLERDKLLN